MKKYSSISQPFIAKRTYLATEVLFELEDQKECDAPPCSELDLAGIYDIFF